MSTGLQARILGPDTHANRPATPASPSLYSCTTHEAIERYTTSGGWEDWVVVGVTGESWQGSWSAGTYTTGMIVEHNDVIYQANTTTTDEPPGADWDVLYTAPGGGAPLLVVDDIALDAAGDEFGDDTMPGWTLSGLTAPTDFTEVADLYDPTCLDVVFSAQGDRFYKAIDSGDWTYYLTLHGVTNGAAASLTALGGMLALVATDNSGTGTGMSLYDDGGAYMWSVASHVYSATGNAIFAPSVWNGTVPATATNFPVVYRLVKSGTTITGGISFNGGASWKTNTRTDSTTFTRIGVTRLFTNGGTNPVLRVGRFNLVP